MAQQAQLAIRFEMRPYLRGKLDASYWLGLIAFEQGNYVVGHRLLSPSGRWRRRRTDHGPWGPNTISLAPRKPSGRLRRPFEQYQARASFRTSYYGNLLRARWLKEAASAGDKRAGETKK